MPADNPVFHRPPFRAIPGALLALATIPGLVLAMAALTASASPADAQVTCGSVLECRPHQPELGLEREARIVAINAALGAATGGLMRAVGGGAFHEGFWAGALGGGVAYVGKRVAVEDFYGAGLLGRQVASLGGSLIRNAAAGRGLFDEVALPVGPVRLYVSGDGVQARLDIATLVTGAAFMIAHDARFDARESLSAGALVFRGQGPMPGLSSAGAMMVWERLPLSEGPRLMAHERVHVLQYDQAFLSWGDPFERWLAGKSSLRPSLLRHIDLGGFVLGVRGGLGLAFAYPDRPWESEAYFLAALAHPVPASLAAGHKH